MKEVTYRLKYEAMYLFNMESKYEQKYCKCYCNKWYNNSKNFYNCKPIKIKTKDYLLSLNKLKQNAYL